MKAKSSQKRKKSADSNDSVSATALPDQNDPKVAVELPNQSLKSKAAKGMAWNAIDRIAVQGINFFIGVVLARLLMPSDYGLIGMLAVFFAISQLFVESGFSNALIQKLDRTETDYSTIFYFNIIISLTFYLILFFTAPLIAQFYNAPELTLLTRVLSLNIPISSLAIVQQARLRIKLDFKTPALISLFSVFISGSLGVYLAYRGFGVWALVFQGLSASVVKTLFLFYFNKWMPQFVFSFASLKRLFNFSSRLLVAGFVSTIVNNLYSLLIGKIFTPQDLGFYTRAKQFPELLSNTISSVLQGVTYPILASLQNDTARMTSVYGRLMRMTVFVVMPFLTLFALLAEPFIRLVLTEKWMPIVPLIQWLCFARMITPISSLNLSILNAIGRSDLFLKVDISKLPMTVAALLITVPFGLKAVVIGHFVTSFIAFFMNAYYPGKMFKLGAIRQIREMMSVIFATLIMSVCVFGITQHISSDFFKLLAGITVGITVYLFSAYLMNIEELNEVKKLALQMIAKKRSKQSKKSLEDAIPNEEMDLNFDAIQKSKEDNLTLSSESVIIFDKKITQSKSQWKFLAPFGMAGLIVILIIVFFQYSNQATFKNLIEQLVRIVSSNLNMADAMSSSSTLVQ